MKRGCHYIFPDGHQCGVAAIKHGGYVLSGEGAGDWSRDDDRLNHPPLSGLGWTRERAAALSERYRYMRDYGLEALRERDSVGPVWEGRG